MERKPNTFSDFIAVADFLVRERYAARAVEILAKAHAAGFFRQPGKIEHMKQDTDLVALHGRAAREAEAWFAVETGDTRTPGLTASTASALASSTATQPGPLSAQAMSTPAPVLT